MKFEMDIVKMNIADVATAVSGCDSAYEECDTDTGEFA